MRWTVLVPVKSLPAAKSRLAPLTAGPDEHARLVGAVRADTLAAAGAAAGVARVLLVTDGGAAGPDRVVARRPGLDAAVREGAAHARAHWPEDGVAVLVGDLPALRPDELADVLVRAAGVERGFVPDADGTGTTTLTVRPGVRPRPRFGAGSAARHAVHATALDAGPGLRRDVDTADDLRAAVGLGVGPATAAAITDLGLDAVLGAAGRSPCLGRMRE